MNETELRENLIAFINKEMENMGNTDVKISNIRLRQRPEWEAFVDISFIWYLNGHEKHTTLTDTLFIFRDGKWISSVTF